MTQSAGNATAFRKQIISLPESTTVQGAIATSPSPQKATPTSTTDGFYLSYTIRKYIGLMRSSITLATGSPDWCSHTDQLLPRDGAGTWLDWSRRSIPDRILSNPKVNAASLSTVPKSAHNSDASCFNAGSRAVAYARVSIRLFSGDCLCDEMKPSVAVVNQLSANASRPPSRPCCFSNVASGTHVRSQAGETCPFHMLS